MKYVGFHGGHSFYELGTILETKLFFEVVNKFVLDRNIKHIYLINEKLYRRYLSFNELDDSLIVMHNIEQIFDGISAELIKSFDIFNNDLKLNDYSQSMKNLFSEYFNNFYSAVQSAKSFYESFGIYQAVKIIPSDTVLMIKEKNRPVEDYDNLTEEDEPFWLRDEDESQRRLGILPSDK